MVVTVDVCCNWFTHTETGSPYCGCHEGENKTGSYEKNAGHMQSAHVLLLVDACEVIFLILLAVSRPVCGRRRRDILEQ